MDARFPFPFHGLLACLLRSFFLSCIPGFLNYTTLIIILLLLLPILLIPIHLHHPISLLGPPHPLFPPPLPNNPLPLLPPPPQPLRERPHRRLLNRYIAQEIIDGLAVAGAECHARAFLLDVGGVGGEFLQEQGDGGVEFGVFVAFAFGVAVGGGGAAF